MLLNKELLKQYCELVFTKTNIFSAYVEKDFYAVSLLKEITSNASNIIFKGGTCLSKCFKIINRFSEDVDLSIIEEHLSESKRRKLVHETIEGSIKQIGLQHKNPENIRSKRAFNRFICNYDQLCFSNGSAIEPNVIVELAMMSPCFPCETRKIQTFIGEYLDSVGKHNLTVQYGLEEFEIKVQKLERTFIDKIFALCDYQISKKITRQSRHIYDLYKIYPLITFDTNLLDLFEEVKKYRIDNPTCYSAKEGQKLNKIFNDLINEETFLNDYNELTYPLLYDRTPYNECIKTLNVIQKYLKENNL